MSDQPQSTPIVEILTIGREILDGRVIDTNSVHMAETLLEAGLVPRYAQRVDDDRNRIQEAFRIADRRSSIILITGGLGPTSDDITAECFAEFLNEDCPLNTDALRMVSERMAALNRPLTETQKKQAFLPRSCFALANPEGTAPGFALERSTPLGKQGWYFMPGVPREMKRMLAEQIMPRLPRVKSYRTRTWATHFTAEADLQDKLREIEKALPPGFEVTYRTRFPENHVGLHANAATPELEKRFEQECHKIGTILEGDSFWEGSGSAQSLEQIVFDLLKKETALLATVESCTAGLIAHRLSDLPGISWVYWSGHVTYDNTAKEKLGVARAILEANGAVSEPTARALAKSGLENLRQLVLMSPDKSKAESPLYCIATTGIAGPSGGTPEKPIGLCHIALAGCLNARDTDVFVRHEELRGRSILPRSMLKTFFSQKALNLLRSVLLEKS